MDGKASIYTEKKLAYYEASYKTSVISKPQEVNLTLTAAHIYGIGYICEQMGTREEDPVYTRFSCGLDEITKIYINDNLKASPLYIQCDATSKGVLNRRRIIIPCLDHVSKIVDTITVAKTEFDQKIESMKKKEKEQKIKHSDSEKPKPEEVAEPIKEDPVKYVAEFLKSVDETADSQAVDFNTDAEVSAAAVEEVNEAPAVEEIVEEKQPKKSSLPPLINPFDYDQSDSDEEQLKKDVQEIVPETPIIENVKPIKQIVTEAQASVKEKTQMDVDDVISEILDNLQAAAEFGGEKETESTPEDYLESDYGLEDISPAEETEYDNGQQDIVEETKPVVEEIVEETEAVEATEVTYEEISEPIQETVEEVKEIEQPVRPVITISASGKSMSLDEFETSVKQLKSMLDNNVINEEEFASEKRKLIANLY